MRVIKDDLWLCVDCLMLACNGDGSGIESPAREAACVAGLEALGPHLVPDFDSDTGEGHRVFSWCGCDSCGLTGGEFHRFAVLGDDSAAV